MIIVGTISFDIQNSFLQTSDTQATHQVFSCHTFCSIAATAHCVNGNKQFSLNGKKSYGCSVNSTADLRQEPVAATAHVFYSEIIAPLLKTSQQYLPNYLRAGPIFHQILLQIYLG